MNKAVRRPTSPPLAQPSPASLPATPRSPPPAPGPAAPYPLSPVLGPSGTGAWPRHGPARSCAKAGHRRIRLPPRSGSPRPAAPAPGLADAGRGRALLPRRGSPRPASVAPSSPRARARRDGWSSRSGSPRPAAAAPYCPRAGARRGRWPQRLCPLAPRRCSPPLCRRGGSQGGEGRSWRRQRRLGRRLLALLLREEEGRG